MSTSREAYDLHNKFCRSHFWKRLRRGGWKDFSWWLLVWRDTTRRVCSKGDF